MSKKLPKPKKDRNRYALEAHFRKAGPMKHKNDKRLKDKLRKQIKEESDD